MGNELRSKWEMVKLGDVCEIVSGTTPKTTDDRYWNGEIPWITPAEITGNSYIINDTQRHITDVAVKESSLKSFPQGTVLLSSRAPIGKVAIAGNEMFCNQGFKNFICSYEINNLYLYWFLKSKTDFLNSLGRGATFKEISKSIVQEIRIPLPPLEIQEKIAKNLDLASDLVKLHKTKLEELDKLIQSVFYDMFGTFLEDENYLMKIPDVCKFIDYRGKTPEKSEEGIPLVTAKNVKMNMFSFEPREFIPENAYDKVMTRGIPQINDVLFTTEAPLGNVCRIPYIDGRFSVGQRLICMQPKQKIMISEYLEYILSDYAFRIEMLKKSTGSTVKGIRSKELSTLSVHVPPLLLQQKFANIVTEIEKQKMHVQKALNDAEMLYSSLMQDYFG